MLLGFLIFVDSCRTWTSRRSAAHLSLLPVVALTGEKSSTGKVAKSRPDHFRYGEAVVAVHAAVGGALRDGFNDWILADFEHGTDAKMKKPAPTAGGMGQPSPAAVMEQPAPAATVIGQAHPAAPVVQQQVSTRSPWCDGADGLLSWPLLLAGLKRPPVQSPSLCIYNHRSPIASRVIPSISSGAVSDGDATLVLVSGEKPPELVSQVLARIA